MLEPIRHILSQQRIVLASASPRRHDLLKMIGLEFEIVPSNYDEKNHKLEYSHPSEFVKSLAKNKAIEVWNRLSVNSAKDRLPDLVIGADTVVTLLDEIMGKPKNAEDASDMLNRLAGFDHQVYTGVALVTRTKKPESIIRRESLTAGSKLESNQNCGPSNNTDYTVTTFHELTDVTMVQLEQEMIDAYIATGEPLDKAGSYGIQGIGGTLIEKIKGDFYNVVGLPLHRFCKELYVLHAE